MGEESVAGLIISDGIVQEVDLTQSYNDKGVQTSHVPPTDT